MTTRCRSPESRKHRPIYYTSINFAKGAKTAISRFRLFLFIFYFVPYLIYKLTQNCDMSSASDTLTSYYSNSRRFNSLFLLGTSPELHSHDKFRQRWIKPIVFEIVDIHCVIIIVNMSNNYILMGEYRCLDMKRSFLGISFLSAPPYTSRERIIKAF